MRSALSALLSRLVDDRKIIILTFELFWISVVLLDVITSRPSGAESASFVYANF